MMPPAQAIRITRMPGALLQERLRARMPKNRMQASTEPPVDGQKICNCWFIAVAAVVVTVSKTVCGVVPLMVTEAGTLQVAGSFVAAGVMAQLRATAPVKPLDGVTVIDDTFPMVAPGATEIDVPIMVRLGVVTGVGRTVKVACCELLL
jgi:hypothetical protein